MRGVVLEAYEHQDLPFDQLIRAVEPRRVFELVPVINMMFAFHKFPSRGLGEGERIVNVLDVDTGVAPMDLFVECIEKDGGVQLIFRYLKELFDDETIERIAEQYQTLLASIAEDPDRPISELTMISAAEKGRLLLGGNPNRREYPRESSVHEMFESQARLHPERTAATHGEQRLTYSQLNRRANQVAHYLSRHRLGIGDVIGICMNRSLEMLVGILGILKSGASYLPLDPVRPQRQLALMLAKAGARAVLTNREFAHHLPQDVQQVFDVDAERSGTGPGSEHDLERTIDPCRRACVLYTSGSTGEPKGVALTHYNIVRLFQATRRAFQFSEQDVWALCHSPASYLSHWEMWGALLQGGQLVLVPERTARSSTQFSRLVHEAGVTVLAQTPSDLRRFNLAEQSHDESKELALRLIVLSGEPLDPLDLQPWFVRRKGAPPQFVIMYGTAETGGPVTYHPVSAADTVELKGSLVGQPIPDIRIHVLDRHQRPAPVGSPGEICIGGGGVADGYVGDSDLTARMFIPDAFSEESGARLFRTGDLGRYRRDGKLEFLGRGADRIKLYGSTIDLGDIERRIRRHPLVGDAKVVAREVDPGNRRLVAYYVPSTAPQPMPNELRRFLLGQLPSYMVPARFVPLECLPLNSAGRVDPHRLP